MSELTIVLKVEVEDGSLVGADAVGTATVVRSGVADADGQPEPTVILVRLSRQ